MIYINTQQEKILNLLRQTGSVGVNSYDLTYKYSIKQAPTRIKELKELGYKIVSVRQKNRSVNYVLVFESSTSSIKPQSKVEEKPKLELVLDKSTNTYRYVRVNTQPVQERIFA